MSQILIVDDDPTTRLVVKKALERQGYAVEIACDGQEGLHLARQLHPALIICDWMMPHMDGIELCRQIKSQPELSATFLILLTSRADVEDRVEGLDAGADEFLSKPIDPNELRARVRAGLRLHQLTRDLQLQTRRLQAELAEAEKYVRSLLPPVETFLAEKISTDWRFIPSQQLGGDCFNYHWLDPDHLALYLLDVSGHGVGAALLSVSLTNVLRSQSLPTADFARPATVLRALNDAFQMDNQNGMYFTIWYGVYCPTHRHLTYASAGHPPAVMVSRPHAAAAEGQITLLKTLNLPIGIMAQLNYKSEDCHIPDPCELYLFSDGAYEVMNPAGEIWGLSALADALSQPADPDQSPLDRTLQLAQTYRGNPCFTDDYSLLQIRFG